MVGRLTEDQQEEIEALHCVYGEEQLKVRLGQSKGVVQMQLQDVPLVRHRCKVTVTLSLTEGYPQQAPVLAIHSAHIEKKILNGVIEEVMENFVEGEPAGHVLLAGTEDALAKLEPGKLAKQYVYCPACSAKDVKKGQPKQPQPGSPDMRECLCCNSKTVVPLRSAKPNHSEKLCDFCFCEDSPLLTLPCKEQVCVECFQRWADLEIGAKKLVKVPGTGELSIACPTHVKSVLHDTSLLKLAAPRTYNLYARFAFDLSAAGAGAVTCPLPGCTNYPFLPGSRHNFMHCPYCNVWFCNVCHSSLVECACVNLKLHAETYLPWPFLKHQPDGGALTQREFEEKLAGAEPVAIRVKHQGGAEDFSVTRDISVLDVMRYLGPKLFHDVQYHGVKSDAWGTISDGSWAVPACMILLTFNGRVLEPPDLLSFAEPGVQLHAVLYYPPTRGFVRELEDEVSLFSFRKQVSADGLSTTPVEDHKKRRGDFLGKACPNCAKPVLHYYRHGCHHIGFAGEGCCNSHWCYVCRGPHPCPKNCDPFCDANRACKCPLCPDCKPGSPCPNCTGCPKCQVFGKDGEFDLFD
eukprot:TRINITY_DN25109_c0_g1_i1.p1 TRINITY_DN25109_c0_g1~~TRINITY_DN25109_c0_g1_i1.p1  ORF type:complete len:613 (+),score=243.17 TRINITY_DN25109_c0_g1_i1:110-1840(+)